ncbi:MAG: hypothetical protein WCR01_15415 [Bacteroidota bacterium]
MEQKDYFLREIEKIGSVLRAILGRIRGREDNLAITINNQFEQTNEQLFNDIGFDLKHCLTLDEPAFSEYLSRYRGFNAANLELLAELVLHFGINEDSASKKQLLKKSLLLYDLCEKSDKTYSFDRERKIKEIKSLL